MTVRSDFEFPARAAVESTAADITVVKESSGPISEQAPPGQELKASSKVRAARSTTGQLVVRYPGQCELSFAPDGSRVGCVTAPGVAEDIVVERVVRFGLLAALVLGGHLAVHASAIEIDGRAVAFAGGSRSGKSTLAALACRRGAGLVTDSVLRVDGSGRCYTGPAELRLRPPADVFRHDAGLLRQRVALDDRVAVEYRQPLADQLGLAAIVLPALDADSTCLGVEQLHGARAAAALTPYLRHWFCQDPKLDAHHLNQLSAVVTQVPVWRCVVPLTPPLDPSYVAELLQRVGLKC